MTKRLTIALIALVALVLVAVMPVSATFYPTNSSIQKGATIYYGEQGLNVSRALVAANNSASGLTEDLNNASVFQANAYVSWWASAAQITTTSPTITVPLGSTYKNLYVLPSTFPYTGTYYLTTSTGTILPVNGGTAPIGVFTVADPTVSVVVWDADQAQNVNGQSVIQGENLTIRVDNTMYSAVDPNLRWLNTDSRTVNVSRADGNANDTTGYLDVKVKTDAGNTLTKLFSSHAAYNAATPTVNLVKLGPNAPQYALNQNGLNAGLNWTTDASDSTGQQAYPAGTYQVYVESYMNGMYDNYKSGGAAYTGKTVAETQTVTIVSNTVKIEANKDSVVRSKQFSVTITGKPNTFYHVWVKGTSTMSGGYDDQPPMFAQNQAGVTNATWAGEGQPVGDNTPVGTTGPFPELIGGYQYQNGGNSRTIWTDVAHGTDVTTRNVLLNGTRVYANVSMSSSGTRTIAFTTTNWTKAQKYTIRVEQYFGAVGYKSDEVDVKVEKGAVTIVAAGDQSYYLGEEIKFSGTNTESQDTYLFIMGPNLDQYGAGIAGDNGLDPRNNAVDKYVSPNKTRLVDAAVQGDNTWSYKWGTATVALDAGTYTIYATSQPSDASSDQLSKVAYGTVSIIIKKPFISATASQSTVAQGDAVFITGTAQGQPAPGVMVWILGKNYANIATQSVNSDGSFSYEIKKENTKTLYAGQYFIVAQHPMQNNRFDVYPSSSNGASVVTGVNQATDVFTADQTSGAYGTAATEDFKLSGSSSLQGSDAAEALIEAINSANVDDTYTKLQILIENPVITIDPVGDRHVGDKFTITATTNLAVDDEVLVEVYSSSFQPTQKSQSGEFSGATGTIKVTKGDSGLNKLSFDVDASTFKPDEYLVKESAVLQDATGTALFNVLEASAPTATPTIVANVTSAAPTTIATQPPTTVATPTKTPTQPGFGALVALIGLGAVALLVVRKH